MTQQSIHFCVHFGSFISVWSKCHLEISQQSVDWFSWRSNILTELNQQIIPIKMVYWLCVMSSY